MRGTERLPRHTLFGLAVPSSVDVHRSAVQRGYRHFHAAWVSAALISYSITWSARKRRGWGIVRLSALAVLRLMTSSNLSGCSTGRSAGFAPRRILLT